MSNAGCEITWHEALHRRLEARFGGRGRILSGENDPNFSVSCWPNRGVTSAWRKLCIMHASPNSVHEALTFGMRQCSYSNDCRSLSLRRLNVRNALKPSFRSLNILHFQPPLLLAVERAFSGSDTSGSAATPSSKLHHQATLDNTRHRFPSCAYWLLF